MSLKRVCMVLAFSATMFASATPVYAASTHSSSVQSHHKITYVNYVIRPGDTLWKISEHFHVSVATLRASNPHVEASDLIPGHALKIPHQVANTVRTTAVKKQAVLPLNYSKELTVAATSYTSGEGATDYLGHKLKFGTIAVDPKVIPLGSKVLVKGMSFRGFPTSFIAYADDEGPAIKGNEIDVFLPVSEQRALDFGIQHVKVFVLK